MGSKLSAALILGAGYSRIAGYPLAREMLFGPAWAPRLASAKEWRAVAEDCSLWLDDNPGRGTEEYLAHLYSVQFGYRAHLWQSAVELIAATYATPVSRDGRPQSMRYSNLLSRPYPCNPHTLFWDKVLSCCDVTGVVTTNYDVLIERSLRHKHMPRLNRPGCYYGGFPLPQPLAGSPENPYAHRGKRIVLNGGIPVYKLHGSVNWGLEDRQITLYSDVRPAFRRPRRNRPYAIVPPIPEKEIPHWLSSVWAKATDCLAEAEIWVVCGYSLPSYDHAVGALFGRALGGNRKRVLILDPAADRVAISFQSLGCASIERLPGLPEGTSRLGGLLCA